MGFQFQFANVLTWQNVLFLARYWEAEGSYWDACLTRKHASSPEQPSLRKHRATAHTLNRFPAPSFSGWRADVLLSPDLHSTPTTAQIFTCLFRQRCKKPALQAGENNGAELGLLPRSLTLERFARLQVTPARWPGAVSQTHSLGNAPGPGVTTWHFWSTSFFSATRYHWLFSILFIFFGVEKGDFHWR